MSLSVAEALQSARLNFRISDLITYISSIITPLQPGDIISPGTPAGVRLGRTPNHWLKPGETIITETQAIDSQSTQ